MPQARVLLGDDHTLVIEGLRKLLSPEFDVVGAVTDARDLVREALRLRPDVVLLDISMPSLSGLEVARHIRRDVPEAKILFLTMHADLSYLRDAMRLGASGYVLKRSAGRELVTAVREVTQGRTYIAPELTAAVEDPKLKRDLARGHVSALTKRQREILALVADGRSDAAIAGRLGVTVSTVRFHRSAIVRKLGISTPASLARYAIEHRITSA